MTECVRRVLTGLTWRIVERALFPGRIQANWVGLRIAPVSKHDNTADTRVSSARIHFDFAHA
jgi:hypothetical protein